MAEPDTQSAQDAGELDEALLRAISHPLRHRLLGMLDGRIASPNQLARELDLPLGRVSYHIRLLSDLGAIELVRHRAPPRRAGALLPGGHHRLVQRGRLDEAAALGAPRDPRPEPPADLRQRDRGRRRRRLRPRRRAACCARRSSSTSRACRSSPGCCARRSTAPVRSAPERPSAATPTASSAEVSIAAFRAPRVSSTPMDGGSTTRARRGGGGAGTGGRVDRRARAAADPGRDGHDDHRRRRGRRRLRARARARDPPGGAAATRGARARGDWAVRARLARLRRWPARCAVLLLFRALQAAGGAAALLAAFQVLDAGESRRGRRLWLGAALVGHRRRARRSAALLTEVFDWRAIFFVQAPLAAAAALALPARGARGGRGRGGRRGERRAGATSAADGGLWSARPASRGPRRRAATATQPAPFRDRAAWPAAAGEAPGRPPRRARRRTDAAPQPRHGPAPPTTTPRGAPRSVGRRLAAALAALALHRRGVHRGAVPARDRARGRVRDLAAAGGARRHDPAAGGARRRGDPRAGAARALAGAVLLAGGAAALAFLPAPSIAWTVVPQLLAGAGMGLALPAFSGELLPERTVGEAARCSSRATSGSSSCWRSSPRWPPRKLESATEQAILQGAALVLDAQIDPLQKLELAPALLDDVDVDSPRAGLAGAVDGAGAPSSPTTPRSTTGSPKRLDDVVVVAVQDAFQAAYLIAAALALLAAALLDRRLAPAPRCWLATARRARHRRRLRVERDRQGPAAGRRSRTRAAQRRCPTPAASPARSRTRRCACSTAAPAGSAPAARSSRSRSSTPNAREAFEREHGVNPRERSAGCSHCSAASAQPPRRRRSRARPRTREPSSAASAARSIGASGSVASTTRASPGASAPAPGGRGQRQRAAQPAGVD